MLAYPHEFVQEQIAMLAERGRELLDAFNPELVQCLAEGLPAMHDLPGHTAEGLEEILRQYNAWRVVATWYLRVLFTTDEPCEDFERASARWILGNPFRTPSGPLLHSLTEARKGILRGVDALELLRKKCELYSVTAERPSPPDTGDRGGQMAMPLDVFVSHASGDVDLVKPIVELIEHALKLDPKRIRCSSIKKYALRGGTDVDEALREEVTSAGFVLGFITQQSVASEYV